MKYDQNIFDSWSDDSSQSKIAKAVKFYNECVEHIAYCETYGKELGFDWDMCRACCSVGKSYSHTRFMTFVANFFGTTVKEMKSFK